MRSERAILALVGAVQFVNVLDFMMVMPLGPDFAAALGIPISEIGVVGGAYTAAAAFSGLLGSLFLDRLDRRVALAVAMAGLVVGTAAGGLATGAGTLLAARVVAGFFGGPATAVSLAIVADVVPPERRGRALGAVMGAFSVASVLGVPAGLELARLAGWRTPFFAVAALGLLLAAGALALLPPLRGHLATRRDEPSLGELLGRPVVRWSYLLTSCTMFSGFLLIPNFSAYLQENLDYPRDRLGLLYMVGGVFSFVALRALGPIVDRHGSLPVAAVAAVAGSAITAFWFGAYDPVVPILALFVAFMVVNSARMVAYNTLASKVPRPLERARFLSIQSAVQHLAAAAGAFVSARVLVVRADGTLGGLTTLAGLSIVASLAVPLVMTRVSARMEPAYARS